MTLYERAESLPEPDRGDIAAVLGRKAEDDATAVREFAGNSRVADGVIGTPCPFGMTICSIARPLDREAVADLVERIGAWARERLA
jgi:hypothetical protein